MAEKLSDQMKELSLEPDKILGKSLETDLNFCLNMKDRFLKSTFDQRVGLRFVCGKISISLLFSSEKRLGEFDARKICTITEDFFEHEMHNLGWCANYKIDQERAVIDYLNYRVTFTYINNSKAGCTGNTVSAEDEEKLCKCPMCEYYG